MLVKCANRLEALLFCLAHTVQIYQSTMATAIHHYKMTKSVIEANNYWDAQLFILYIGHVCCYFCCWFMSFVLVVAIVVVRIVVRSSSLSAAHRHAQHILSLSFLLFLFYTTYNCYYSLIIIPISCIIHCWWWSILCRCRRCCR